MELDISMMTARQSTDLSCLPCIRTWTITNAYSRIVPDHHYTLDRMANYVFCDLEVIE